MRQKYKSPEELAKVMSEMTGLDCKINSGYSISEDVAGLTLRVPSTGWLIANIELHYAYDVETWWVHEVDCYFLKCLRRTFRVE